MVYWRFFGPGGSIRQLHQQIENMTARMGSFLFIICGRELNVEWDVEACCSWYIVYVRMARSVILNFEFRES